MYDNDGLALQSFYNIFLDAHGNILIISHHVHSVCIGQDLKYLEWCAGLLWIHLCYSVTGDFSYTETLRHKLDVYLNKGVTIYHIDTGSNYCYWPVECSCAFVVTFSLQFSNLSVREQSSPSHYKDSDSLEEIV